MSKNKTKSLSFSFLNIAIVSMVVLSLVFVIAGSTFITRAINRQVTDRMVDLSETLLASMDSMYPGDFAVSEKNGEIFLLKGEHLFNGDFDFIDEIKSITGVDISVDYQNYAVITTFCDENGNRLVGAGDNKQIVEDVIDTGKEKFYTNVVLGKENYYAYYVPLFDANQDVIGMLCVAESSQYVKDEVWRALTPVLLISLAACIIVCVFTYKNSKVTVDAILKVQKYMKALSQENFSAELDPTVSKRTDEIGDMGLSAVAMSASLRKKVEEDQLTSLYNRRSAHKYITGTINSYIDKGTKFCLAMGDIDFFKKVNDTYGHDAGDLVLIAVSKTLKQNMIGKGYAIRWGGEEFILVFENIDAKTSIKYMNQIMDEVRSLRIKSKDQIIKVNMTFGLMECEESDKEFIRDNESNKNETRAEFAKKRMEYYINSADKKLYYGKENGRNQLVF